MPASLEDWIEEYRLAWENRDPKAAGDLFSPTATYRSNIFEEAHQGREGIEDYWGTVTKSQSEISVRMGRPFVDGSRVAVEFWTTMRAEGAEVTLPGCLLLDFDESWVCHRLREYWQIGEGWSDPPAEWGV